MYNRAIARFYNYQIPNKIVNRKSQIVNIPYLCQINPFQIKETLQATFLQILKIYSIQILKSKIVNRTSSIVNIIVSLPHINLR